MRTFSKFTLRLAAASIMALVPASASLADPGLTDVTPHRHFLVTANGEWVPIGPQVCEDPDLQDAFNQFHNNIHHSVGETLGPQGGAPGLHNEEGADMLGRLCSFSPDP